MNGWTLILLGGLAALGKGWLAGGLILCGAIWLIDRAA